MKKLSLLNIFTLLTFFHCLATAHADQSFEAVEIKVIPVAGTVSMLEGSGGNIGASVGEDGILIVDDQFAPLSNKIDAALAKLNPGRVRFLLNTHWHGDHTGGNQHFGSTGSTIIAQTNVRSRLTTRQEVKLFQMVNQPQPKEALPVITFDNSLSVHFNGEEVRLVHLPNGHTDSDSVVFFTKSNVVHLGDHLFNGMYPFIDLDSGGSVTGYIKNVAMLIQIIPDDAKLIPGHGPLGTVSDLKNTHKMLLETTEIVKSKMKDGKSLEEIQAEGFPEELESNWGKGVITAAQWIDIVYRSNGKQ